MGDHAIALWTLVVGAFTAGATVTLAVLAIRDLWKSARMRRIKRRIYAEAGIGTAGPGGFKIDDLIARGVVHEKDRTTALDALFDLVRDGLLDVVAGTFHPKGYGQPSSWRKT